MADEWRRVGLIVNPAAGSGIDVALQSARQAVVSLGAETVCTAEGPAGADALSGWPGKIIAHYSGAKGREQTRALARWLVDQRVRVVVVVGGDGTLADVAQVFIASGCRTPVLGIGAGSTNVGCLITCRTSEASKLHSETLESWDVNCLIATVNDSPLGYAFNDVVIGHTIVGTMDGRLRDIDAAEHMRGTVTAGKPRSIATTETRVLRRDRDGDTLVAEGKSVATVVAGFAEPAFLGKAITGGVCLASFTGLPAGCLVSSFPLVQVEIGAPALLKMPPIVSSYVTLSEETSIVVENVEDSAVLCVDGNPLRRLNEADRVVISVHKGAVQGIRFRRN